MRRQRHAHPDWGSRLRRRGVGGKTRPALHAQSHVEHAMMNNQNRLLEGRRVLVTGGARGLGYG
ncbi:hypothetical protein KQH89_11685, partial [Vibrio cholerae]|uniref:hypothetical protein n=1 Tax=Vibrio cholerae TaxID=666 RepID=UPI001C10BA0E|nr:hypothetical protein [Vibrio cholerae]